MVGGAVPGPVLRCGDAPHHDEDLVRRQASAQVFIKRFDAPGVALVPVPAFVLVAQDDADGAPCVGGTSGV